MNHRTLILIYKKDEIGELKLSTETAELSFSYSQGWMDKKGFPLSPKLPINLPVSSEAIKVFLENILPEGKGLDLLRSELKINSNNIFDVIKAIGKDVAGAIRFVEKQDAESKTEFTEITKEELESKISQRAYNPIYKWHGRFRLSMAGVQEKLPITIINNSFGFGEGNLSSTHLLKFNSLKIEHLCLNEYYCLQLAKQIGLNVVDSELLDFGEKVLCIKRFDRFLINNSLVDRIHTIDLCQALGLTPEQKYERLLGDSESVKDIWGPANAENLFNISKHCEVPAKEKLKLLDWCLFNLLIGNCDNHFKNISFFAEGNKLKLSPFYDLVSIVDVYKEVSQSLSFQIGSTFNFFELNSFHLREFSEEAGFKISYVNSRLKFLIEKIKRNLYINFDKLSAEENQFLDKIHKQIIKKINYIETQLKN